MCIRDSRQIESHPALVRKGIMHSQPGLRAAGFLVTFILLPFLPADAATPIKIDTKNLLVTVDAAACRWSAEVKGTPMRLNTVYFLHRDVAGKEAWTTRFRVSDFRQQDKHRHSGQPGTHEQDRQSG